MTTTTVHSETAAHPDAAPATALHTALPTGERLLSARGFSVRLHRRTAWVSVALMLLIAVTVAASLVVGEFTISVPDAVATLLGDAPDQITRFFIHDRRLPRALVAVAVGAALAISGALFCALTRNPLASPDIIGISSGASAAAVFSIVMLSLSETAVSFVATIAALVTAGTIYLLSFKGGLSGTRLILIGIGIAAMLQSVVSYVISRAAQWDLQTAMRWLNGNLNGATMDQAAPLIVAVVIGAVFLTMLSKSLGTLRLGEETSAALGVSVERTRLLLILFAVTLLAFATAAAGPVAFVAFLSGPISVRLLGRAGSAGSPLIPAALVGALLILVADFAGQYAFGTRYPVGVITGVLGAPYLIYLLVRSTRSGGAQ